MEITCFKSAPWLPPIKRGFFAAILLNHGKKQSCAQRAFDTAAGNVNLIGRVADKRTNFLARVVFIKCIGTAEGAAHKRMLLNGRKCNALEEAS